MTTEARRVYNELVEADLVQSGDPYNQVRLRHLHILINAGILKQYGN